MKTISILIAALAAAVVTSCSATGGTVKTGVKPYTSNMCVLTDNELGSMGPVITKVYGNREVKFCCQPCVKKFERNLDENLSKL